MEEILVGVEIEEIKKIIHFTQAEKEAISGFGLPLDAFLPLILSIRFGGDWSYSSEEVRSLAVQDRTTMYDESQGMGHSLEEIYLFVNPELLEKEGRVRRLEKCGEKEERVLVERPYRIRVRGDRVLKATVDPSEMEILLEELFDREIVFEGSNAFDFAHELEHLQQKEVRGGGLWNFVFKTKDSIIKHD